MKNKIRYTFLLGMTVSSLAAQTVSYETQGSTGSGSWSNRKAKLIDIQQGFAPDKDAALKFNRYGSRKDIKGSATGFFHAEKIDGRWWIIDPDGYAGFNIAVNSMNGVSSASEVQVHYDRLRELGYNGIGNFLSNENFTKSYYNNQEGNEEKLFSYTRRVNFYSNYKSQRKRFYPNTPAIATNTSTRDNYIFALDPTFPKYCVDLVESQNLYRYNEERELLGFFLDNELNFNQDLLRNFLRDMPEGDPAFEAANKFITEKGINKDVAAAGNAPEAVKQEFAGIVAERYFHVTDSILKIYVPNHMNLGSRLHGRPRDIEAVVKASAKYCDIVSVNFYDKYSPNEQITSSASWKKWIDKPCLVTEFYTKGLDATAAGFVNGFSGAGWVVKTQRERGYFYQNTCIELLQSKIFVGWHYFKHMDDKDSNKGILNTSKEEYTDLTSQMKLLNDNRYEYIDFYDGRITSIGNDINDSFPYLMIRRNCFSIRNVQKTCSVKVMNLSGHIVLSASVCSDTEFSLSNPGIYLISIEYDSDVMVKKMIIKKHLLTT